MSNPYDEDEWYETDEERYEREAAEFASRPYRFSYKFTDRKHADVGAGFDVDEDMLRYLRYWAGTGLIDWWKIVRVSDNVTLADWTAPASPTLPEKTS